MYSVLWAIGEIVWGFVCGALLGCDNLSIEALYIFGDHICILEIYIKTENDCLVTCTDPPFWDLCARTLFGERLANWILY